jgi:hypothetical protein
MQNLHDYEIQQMLVKCCDEMLSHFENDITNIVLGNPNLSQPQTNGQM